MSGFTISGGDNDGLLARITLASITHCKVLTGFTKAETVYNKHAQDLIYLFIYLLMLYSTSAEGL